MKELSELDLETLKHVKYVFELYSDSTCRTLGYKYINKAIEVVENLAIAPVSLDEQSEATVCHVCDGRGKGNFEADSQEINCDTCEGTGQTGN
jgi:RecJ-like exonuclease